MINEKEEASIEIETLKRDLIEKIHECDTLQSQLTDAVASKDTEVGELKAKLAETEQKYQVRVLKMSFLCDKFRFRKHVRCAFSYHFKIIFLLIHVAHSLSLKFRA